MARPLRDSPPSSAVARLLDTGAAARAIGATTRAVPDATSTGAACASATMLQCAAEGAGIPIKREFVLTPATERALLVLIDSIRRGTGARVSASHVLRALLIAVEHAQANVGAETRRIGPLRLPSNARGRDTERSAFERRIAAAMAAGMRAAAAFDPDQ